MFIISFLSQILTYPEIEKRILLKYERALTHRNDEGIIQWIQNIGTLELLGNKEKGR